MVFFRTCFVYTKPVVLTSSVSQLHRNIYRSVLLSRIQITADVSFKDAACGR